jgi:hypothetical protein
LIPWFGKHSFGIINDFLIDEVLLCQATELIKPSFANNFTAHRSSESIFSQLAVLIFVSECIHRSFNSLSQLVMVVVIHRETRSLL